MPFKVEQLVGIGIVTIVIGFLLVFFGALFGAKEGASNIKVAVGGFIGFIPFGFGNDKKLVWFVTVISIVLFLLWLAFRFRVIRNF